jgi:tetratricopeptide (TPR) repeat protein
MPKRRPQDVVNVVMTDHFIRRNPGGPELLAAREEREPSITHIESSDDLYNTMAFVRATSGADAASVRRLEELLATRKPPEIEPYLDLGSGLLRQRRWKELEATANLIVAKDAKQELALEWRAIAGAALTGDTTDAICVLSTLSRPEAAFNAGVFLAQSGRMKEAIPLYERALAARPNMAAAWYRLGEAKRAIGDRAGARDAFQKTLAIEPGHTRAREALAAAGQ